MNNTIQYLQKLTSKTILSVVFLLGTLSSTLLYAASPTPLPQFHIRDQWNLGGTGGWGYLVLDAPAHRLYIPRTNRVMVVDTDTGKLLGEVEGMKNIRAIALDDSGKYGYVTDPTDGSAGFVRVFDRSSLKLVASVPTGAVPAAIVFDPSSKSIFAFNSHSHSATVIDATTNQVTATIPLAGRPGSAITDGNGNVFVTLPALGEIIRIDATAKNVSASWQLTPCTGPSGLAIDSVRHQLFTTCEDHKLITLSSKTGQVAAIADGPANAGDLDFDSRHNLLFVADTTGTLSIFRRESLLKYSRIQQVKTQPGARTMIVSQNDAKAYLVTSRFGQNTGAASEELQFRPTPIPGSFSVIVVGR
ncbi:YncE family protein [Tunturiibacter gelidoferens]|uniref:YVTN family beta-propeller protein n=1 Tax=Tunturiibacter gelidiferens TaxID=3069689 RepID=A0ACC5NTK3_9BACT|nr:YncE family protein [Edaphobacter lichenicola]MBB5337913.1 YVTN family beta-propeller protein [Edaphobacter lichenicola]